jgi:hypothetical protein
MGHTCDNALADFLSDPPPEALACTRNIRKCNVNIFCAPKCGPVGGMTFPSDGFVHICIPEIDQVSRRQYYGLILHECRHAGQLLENRALCKGAPWPDDRPVTIPPLGKPTCKDCKELELEAYTAQAHFLYPDPPRGSPRDEVEYARRMRSDFVRAGICASCKHVCPEFITCPPPPPPPILIPEPLPGPIFEFPIEIGPIFIPDFP